MLSDEFLNQIFRNNQEKIDRKISYEYHKRLKLIKEQKNEERENIKQGIIAELYYKEGFKDGIDFIIKHMKKLMKIIPQNPCKIRVIII